jgi:phenylacetate-CoA ligase
MEYSIAEILDEDGNEVNEGEMGRKIVTSLWNFSTPFIRFDSKDIVQKGTKCSCGRGLETIKKIKGRDNDILVTPDGNFLIAQSFTVYFKLIRAIDQFQVYQPSKKELIFKLVVNESYNSSLEKEIINHWKNYTNNTMIISIDKVDQIGLLKSGKRRFLIRNKEINLGF